MSMGKGSIYSTANAQKLVSRSSTESELVGAHDVMPQILWTANFMKGQGQSVGSILFQDNMSAMLLEKNGRASSSKRTRHIKLRYFFIKDCVDKGEIMIEHCPTEEMVGDFFTKPLQGKLFYRLRDLIMHIDPSSSHHSVHRSVLRQVRFKEQIPDGLATSAKDLKPVPEPTQSFSMKRRAERRSYKEALLATNHE